MIMNIAEIKIQLIFTKDFILKSDNILLYNVFAKRTAPSTQGDNRIRDNGFISYLQITYNVKVIMAYLR